MLHIILDTTDITVLQETGLHTKLAEYVNDLILHHFDELLNLLYRLDVSEQKLKALLHENKDGDAGSIIATLIIERQVQKIKFRQQYGRNTNYSDEEKW